jgi:hypothetical protein
MAFKIIETVKVNNLVGRAFNGYIYACNVSIGFSESPTKVILNIVSENAFDDFSNDIYDFNLGSNLYKIEIGSLIFEDLSLISAEETYEVGKHFATLTFLDKSYILDKIFVGLINRHGKEGIVDKEYQFNIKVMCEDCSVLPNFNGKVKEQDVMIKRTLNVGKYAEISQKGGYILLGEEEFVENKCDLPDINYNFTSLATILKESLGTVLTVDSSINQVDLNRDYRQAYIGSLREVLSNWCSDFGFTFYYDFRSKSIKFIDLRSPINNVSAIKNEILKYRNATSSSPSENSYTQKIIYKKTIEDTYDQNHISYYVKSAQTKEKTYNKYYPYRFSPLTLSHVFGLSAAFKTIPNLYASCALAKYAPDFRTLFHLLIDEWRPLGITRLSNRFSSSDLTDLAVYGFGVDNLKGLSNNIDGSVYLISYSQDSENFWLNWERDIANNFIGRYQALLLNPKKVWDEAKSCSTKQYRRKTFTTEPESKFTDYLSDLPFSYLLMSSSNLGVFFGSGFQQGLWKFIIFERDAAWGTDQGSFLDYLDVQAAQQYKPYIIQLDDLQKQKLTKALELSKRYSLLNQAKNNYNRLAIAFMPSANQINRVFRVSFGTRRNGLEVLGQNAPNVVGEKQDCITECEEDIIRENCKNCNNTLAGFEEPAFRGLIGNAAQSITVSFLGSWGYIVFPVEALYGGYAKEENQEKRVIPATKNVFGSLNENLNKNTMNLQIVESNITNDFDAILNSNNQYILNAPFPVSVGENVTTYQNLTPQDYHTKIHSKLSHSVNFANESISCEIIGGDFSRLSSYLYPDKGLNSIDISLDSTEGLTSVLSFSNRPSVLPRKEVYFKNTIIKNALSTIGQSTLG